MLQVVLNFNMTNEKHANRGHRPLNEFVLRAGGYYLVARWAKGIQRTRSGEGNRKGCQSSSSYSWSCERRGMKNFERLFMYSP